MLWKIRKWNVITKRCHFARMGKGWYLWDTIEAMLTWVVFICTKLAFSASCKYQTTQVNITARYFFIHGYWSIQSITLALEQPRGWLPPHVFFNRHNSSARIFQKRFRTLPHLLVHKFQNKFAPTWISIEKSEVPRGTGYHPHPRSQLLDKIGTKFQQLPLCFQGQGIQRYYWEYCPTYPEVRNRRWRLPIWKYIYLDL